MSQAKQIVDAFNKEREEIRASSLRGEAWNKLTNSLKPLSDRLSDNCKTEEEYFEGFDAVTIYTFRDGSVAKMGENVEVVK